jgi:hypothetical protein
VEGKDSSGRAATWIVAEYWQDLDQSLTAECGGAHSDQLTFSEGFTVKTSLGQESSFGASIGKKDVASIQAGLKTTLGVEISWTAMQERQIKAEVSAKECGTTEVSLWQLYRDYDVTIQRGGLFGRLFGPVKRYYRQKTSNYMLRRRASDEDPICGCKPSVKEVKGDLVDVIIGDLQVILQAVRVGASQVAQFEELTLEGPFGALRTYTVPSGSVPDFLLDLAGVARTPDVAITAGLHQHETYQEPTPQDPVTSDQQSHIGWKDILDAVRGLLTPRPQAGRPLYPTAEPPMAG